MSRFWVIVIIVIIIVVVRNNKKKQAEAENNQQEQQFQPQNHFEPEEVEEPEEPVWQEPEYAEPAQPDTGWVGANAADSGMLTCPNCGAQGGGKFCEYCGTPLMK